MIKHILAILVLFILSSTGKAQKQLDSLHVNFFRNGVWSLETKRTYVYLPLEEQEFVFGFSKTDNKFLPQNLFTTKYSPTCDGEVIETQNYTYSQNAYVHNKSSVYERNNNCSIIKESNITVTNGVGNETFYYEYSDFDQNSRYRNQKYFLKDANGDFELQWERVLEIVYNNDQKLSNYTIIEIKNGVSTPVRRINYTYYIDGKLKDVLFEEFSNNAFVKSNRFSYSYTAQYNTYVFSSYNNTLGEERVINLDTTYLDSDLDPKYKHTYNMINNEPVINSRTDYFYKKVSSVREKVALPIQVKAYGNGTIFNYTIENPEALFLRFEIYNVNGSQIYNGSRNNAVFIKEQVRDFFGLKVVHIIADDGRKWSGMFY